MKRLSKDQKQQRADLVTRPMPTNSNPYSRNRSDRQQPGALTLGKRGRLGRGAPILPTALAAEVSAARPGTTFRNAHPRSVPGHSRRSDGQQASPNVRYAFNGDQMCPSQRTDAMCQNRL
jgi:hypothetical protein